MCRCRAERGRPNKTPKVVSKPKAEQEEGSQPKAKRGRPKKTPKVVGSDAGEVARLAQSEAGPPPPDQHVPPPPSSHPSASPPSSGQLIPNTHDIPGDTSQLRPTTIDPRLLQKDLHPDWQTWE